MVAPRQPSFLPYFYYVRLIMAFNIKDQSSRLKRAMAIHLTGFRHLRFVTKAERRAGVVAEVGSFSLSLNTEYREAQRGQKLKIVRHC